QYQNAVTDLIGSFQEPFKWGTERGLHAEYFQKRNPWDAGDAVVDRTDPQVEFDFGTDSPSPGKLKPEEFSGRWSGSVLAPDTGEYEFIVRTQHSCRLYVNDALHPLVDDWVKSGNDIEHRGTIRLLGGRPYRITLEYAKAEAPPVHKPKPKKKDKDEADVKNKKDDKGKDNPNDKPSAKDKSKDEQKAKDDAKEKQEEPKKEEEQPEKPQIKS